MTNEELQQKIQAQFKDSTSNFDTPYGMLTFEVQNEFNLKVMRYLKDELGFSYLNDLTAVHYPDQVSRELCVVYMLQDIRTGQRVRLKAYTNIEKPDVFTATSLFETANWLEREAYDFYGVNFVGHPNLKRILNVDEMDYFPMRKEFPVEDQTRIDKDDAMFGR